MADKLAWGILATGTIARAFARGVQGSATGELVAVGSRAQASADAFGTEFGISRRHGSYEALLADDAVEAVYIATPHPMHAEWAIKAAEAGKHILCEKPLAINHAEAMAIVEAARRNDVFLMEAFMYRCHPQTETLVELIRKGTIGQVRVIEASFGFNTTFDPEGRALNNALGGGGILDVGCYPVSMARLIAGVATGAGFVEPLEVQGYAHIGEVSHVDEYAVATMLFPGDILAQVSTAVQANLDNTVGIYGSEGKIVVLSPWMPGRDGTTPTILVQRDGEEPREIAIESKLDLYAYEADTVTTFLGVREASTPAMSWDDSLGNMKALDAWRESIGLVYDLEQPAAQTLPVHKRPLAARPDHNMRYGHIEGVDKPMSRLVMGVDNQRTMGQVGVMFDDFFERGGTCFDSAYIYGGGQCEKLLGQWIANRGIREQVVILDKGAHTPHCNPGAMTAQLLQSLERLQTDYVDIYMLHRDNPDVPVGEFIDALNEHRRAGRIRVFGASNWTFERVREANAYAREHGLAGFSAVSNNFSLARMVEPPWAGCLSASDAASRAWLTETQTPLMPWSSQARGFFTPRARPDDHSDPELVRCWYSDDNFARKERVIRMARDHGVLPINVALAYVLCQPFPTFPLIGPRTLHETTTSLPALDLELTPDELRWLNLED